MAKLTYLVSNTTVNTLSIGSIGSLAPGEQRSFVVEEDDYNDQAISALVANLQATATFTLFRPISSQDHLTNAELATTRLLSKVQTLTYAAAITPDASLGCTLNIPVSGAITMNAPINPQWVGQPLTFNLSATGVFVITWNSGAGGFKKAADGVSAASTYASKTFVWNGSFWVQQGGALAYL